MPGSIKKAVALNTLVLLLPMAASAESNMQDAVDETENTTENTAGQTKKPGYHAAGFRIRPSVSVTGKFDDNIFATDTDEESDFITVISPRLNVDSTWDKHSLRFKVGADVGRYGDFDAENYDDFWLTADGKYNLTPSTDIFGGLGYGSEHEGRDSPDAVLGGLSPTTYTSRNGYVGIKTLQDSTTYRIGLTYEDLDFEDVLDAAGGSIINDDRDRELWGLGVRATHNLDKGRDVYLQALYDIRDYDETVDQNGYERDSDGYRVALGLKNNFDSGNKVEAYIGYFSQDYDDDTFSSVDSMDFGGSFTYRPNANTKLTGNLVRTLNETTIAGSSGYINTSFSGKLEHRISQQLIPYLSLGYAESDFQDHGREDQIYSAEAAVKYYVARNAFFTAGYRHVERDSNDFGLINSSDDYEKDSVFVTFTSQGYPIIEPYISDYSTHGEVEIGALYLSDDSKRFGRYTGLDSSGTRLNGSFLVESKDSNNGWATLEGRDLGLDSRSLDIDWGSQGEYTAWLNYNQQPFTQFVGSSIFEGIGSTFLGLPTVWDRGDTTADLTDLTTSLQEVEIGTMRKKLGIGSSFIQKQNWTISVGYETETKEGFQQVAGIVGHAPGDPARAVMLPAPIDYTTNVLKASLGYFDDQTSLNLAYQSSFFMNNLKAVTWENPFDGKPGPR
ncbi:MAG: outer membrane beta-barrel protein, partial [Gammaproteobacteria bacterium]